ncbi:endonuclease/exonuclease/phosphatase [Streptomyces sp. A0958]|uniref:RNA repair domain-containing protein n=1 Tax=Streptomyces sp. A0958 TaxID=2563101 RepID=UPI00109E9D70|nr:RNA repair domain-containing protein [Streptomyces sp. A0958]THA72914.1 endonuclease/exonuclease/phosphatase [Streptomyces sp. A0958]
MRTSEEIYHRVRWDARFDPARFVLGVAQRGREPKRVPLDRFTPGGDIPWHRVLFFEADGELVWDRATGTDRIDATDAGRIRESRRLPPPYFTARTPHTYSPATGTWEPAPARTPGPPGPPGPLTVLTWNTLWDRYDSDRIDTARRRPLLTEALRAADADVIALQEVEPALLTLLLACDWIREGYTLATEPSGHDVPDLGLLLLSRLPVSEAAVHVLGPHKAVAAAVVETADGPVTVAVTHLSSDHSPKGAVRRDTELADVATGLASVAGELLLVGDFNDGGDRPQTRLAMADAWTEIHGPADDTPTFDPSTNPLAAISSLSGRVSRLDRVLLRTDRLRARTATLWGEAPGPGGLYVSDHYGVRVELGAASPAAGGETAGSSQAAGAETAAASPVAGAETARSSREAGAGTAGSSPAAEAETAGSSQAAEAVTARVAAALPWARVHLVGSRRMGCARPGADLDLVAALPDLSGVRDRLAAAFPEARGLREVTGARVPGLRWCVDGLRVDLVTVATGAMPPTEAVARRAELGGAAAVALSAVSDAEAVLTAAEPHREAFTALAREVKEWAAARGLDSAPCGGLPGIAWALLAARTAHEGGGLRDFFATWAAWDWRDPVGGGPADGHPVTVYTPTSPVRSCTTQVSPAGLDLLTAELFRAWETLDAADADARGRLCAPPPLTEHRAWALAAAAPSDEGRLRGRLLALTTALSEAGAPDVRVWPRSQSVGSRTGYAIGLGARPPEAHRLAEIGAEVLRGIKGASLAWTDRVGA